ncbi:unnamed protein product, partial [Protopolystoma xenopodis]
MRDSLFGERVSIAASPLQRRAKRSSNLPTSPLGIGTRNGQACSQLGSQIDMTISAEISPLPGKSDALQQKHFILPQPSPNHVSRLPIRLNQQDTRLDAITELDSSSQTHSKKPNNTTAGSLIRIAPSNYYQGCVTNFAIAPEEQLERNLIHSNLTGQKAFPEDGITHDRLISQAKLHMEGVQTHYHPQHTLRLKHQHPKEKQFQRSGLGEAYISSAL